MLSAGPQVDLMLLEIVVNDLGLEEMGKVVREKIAAEASLRGKEKQQRERNQQEIFERLDTIILAIHALGSHPPGSGPRGPQPFPFPHPDPDFIWTQFIIWSDWFKARVHICSLRKNSHNFGGRKFVLLLGSFYGLCPGATCVATTLQRWLFGAAEPHHVCLPLGQKSEKARRLPSQYIPPQKPCLTTWLAVDNAQHQLSFEKEELRCS